MTDREALEILNDFIENSFNIKHPTYMLLKAIRKAYRALFREYCDSMIINPTEKESKVQDAVSD